MNVKRQHLSKQIRFAMNREKKATHLTYCSGIGKCVVCTIHMCLCIYLVCLNVCM